MTKGLPIPSASFSFLDREVCQERGEIRLGFALDDRKLVECLAFPSGMKLPDPDHPALDLLHWVSGVSYWKAGCPPSLRFSPRPPDAWQAAWLEKFWRKGLAEFAWRNGLGDDIWPRFHSTDAPRELLPQSADLPDRALVPMGGGKDSLVALERVRKAGVDACTAAVSDSSLIRDVAASTGLRYFGIRRRLDPALAEMNRAGAWNGHVPVTAINAALLIILALGEGFRWIVFANERSADEPTVLEGPGAGVNHQFSKSLEFESMLAGWIGRYISRDLKVFSILRRDREMAICKEFALLDRYHQVFSSCNRNFHLDGHAVAGRWCQACPKCLFVFLGLACFLPPRKMEAIFGGNLLDRKDLEGGFRDLLALGGSKPFECVGEVAESRAALFTLAGQEDWKEMAVVKGLSGELDRAALQPLDSLLAPVGDHRIPGIFLS